MSEAVQQDAAAKQGTTRAFILTQREAANLEQAKITLMMLHEVMGELKKVGEDGKAITASVRISSALACINNNVMRMEKFIDGISYQGSRARSFDLTYSAAGIARLDELLGAVSASHTAEGRAWALVKPHIEYLDERGRRAMQDNVELRDKLEVIRDFAKTQQLALETQHCLVTAPHQKATDQCAD